MEEEGFSTLDFSFLFLPLILFPNTQKISQTTGSTSHPGRVLSMVGSNEQIVSEMDGVFVTYTSFFFFLSFFPSSILLFFFPLTNAFLSRLDSRNTEGDAVYLYQITNKRANDVMVNLELSGKNSNLTPLGTSESISDGKIVEGVVRKGQEVLLGQVEAIDPTASLEFSCAVQVERSDSEIREDEIQGVTLITTIEHGYTRQITFYVRAPHPPGSLSLFLSLTFFFSSFFFEGP